MTVLVSVFFCFGYINADFSKLWSSRTVRLLSDIAQAAVLSRLSANLLTQLLPLSLQTLAMSILAIALAGLGGILLSFSAANTFFCPVVCSIQPDKTGLGDRCHGWGYY